MPGVREQGVVVDVGPHGASVRIHPASEENCASCGACGAGDASGSRILRVPTSNDLAPGARVVVETSPVSLLSASLLLLVPLVGLIVGAAVGGAVGSDLGLGDEGGSIVGGLLLMAIAYLSVVFLDRRIRRRPRSAGPRIVEVSAPLSPPGDTDALDVPPLIG